MFLTGGPGGGGIFDFSPFFIFGARGGRGGTIFISPFFFEKFVFLNSVSTLSKYVLDVLAIKIDGWACV